MKVSSRPKMVVPRHLCSYVCEGEHECVLSVSHKISGVYLQELAWLLSSEDARVCEVGV